MEHTGQENATPAGEEPTGAAAMFANDRASQHLGITVDDHGPGWAQCSMTVTEIMTNGHDITHGGYIFLFADTTFAMACNYPGSITVASGGDIDFLKPTHLGDELVARGHEVIRQGRSGIYDVTVNRGDEIIATYRGRSRTLPAPKPASKAPKSASKAKPTPSTNAEVQAAPGVPDPTTPPTP